MAWQVELVRNLGTVLGQEEPLQQLWVCSAFTSAKGARALQTLIRASHTRHAILGCNALTEWQAVECLAEWGVQVQLRPDPAEGIFHPKCFYAEAASGQAWVLAGSANLTESGIRGNIEAGLRFTGPKYLPVMRDTRRFFADLAEASAPLTPELLAQLKEVQEEIQRVAPAAWPGYPWPAAAPEQGNALLFSAVGRALVTNVNVRRFCHYIEKTVMEASYKMVILPLLLQAPAGRLDMLDLARAFRQFYLLLEHGHMAPEQAPFAMSRVRQVPFEKVVAVLRDAPKRAFLRAGFVDYPGNAVEINRPVWDAMTPSDRDHARSLAVKRLTEYYREHLGYAIEFSHLLLVAAGWRHADLP